MGRRLGWEDIRERVRMIDTTYWDICRLLLSAYKMILCGVLFGYVYIHIELARLVRLGAMTFNPQTSLSLLQSTSRI
jgi:hypothetical protein